MTVIVLQWLCILDTQIRAVIPYFQCNRTLCALPNMIDNLAASPRVCPAAQHSIHDNIFVISILRGDGKYPNPIDSSQLALWLRAKTSHRWHSLRRAPMAELPDH